MDETIRLTLKILHVLAAVMWAGAAAFEHRSRGDKQQQEAQRRRIAALEEKLKAKNEVLAELMEEHVAQKKVLRRSEGPMGTPRHARPGGGLGPPRAAEDRAFHPPLHRLAGPADQQVLRLAGALREGQRTQWLDSPRLLVGGLGETGHPRLPPALSAGGLPAPDLHDAGCRHRGRQPGQRVAGAPCKEFIRI